MSQTPIQFINNNSIDVKSRQSIRSHVMKGKNVGKKRVLRKQQRQGSSSNDSKIIMPQRSSDPKIASHSLFSVQKWHASNLFSPRILFNVGDDLGRITSPFQVVNQDRKDISHFLTRFSEMIYPPQFSLGSRMSKAIFVQSLFLDEAYFHIFVSMARACFDYISEDQNISRSEIYHHCQALRLLNMKLASPHALSELSVSSVIAFCLHSYLRQDAKQMNVHFEGLIKMIKLRGGMGSLIAYPALMDKVRRIDVDISMQLDIPLHLEFVPIFPAPIIASLLVSDCDLPPPFKRYLQEASIQLYMVARDITRVTQFMSTTMVSPDIAPGVLQEVLMSLFYRILNIDTITGSVLSDTIAKATHIILLGFMTLALVRFDEQRRRQYRLVSRQCASQINCASFIEAMSNQVEVRFWMLTVAGCTILEDCSHHWLIPQLRETIDVLGISVWSEALSILKKYPWISAIQDEPAHQLWATCFEERNF